MRAVYLTGESIAMRAMLAGDKEVATAWFDSPFPINATRAEEFLKEEHKDAFESATLLLAIVGAANDDVLGGVKIWRRSRYADITIHMAPWLEHADELRAEALRLLVPWLRDERESLLLETAIDADHTATLATAEELSLRQMARLREHVARPGGRVDRLIYQWFHPSLDQAEQSEKLEEQRA